jgi:formate dehydrogenase subunit gamma
MVRISAAVAAVVLAVLLAWTIKASLEPDPIVVPTDGVLHGKADQVPAGDAAQKMLRNRALLQRWREVPGVTSIEPVTAGIELAAEPSAEEPEQLVARWLEPQEKFFELLRDRGYLKGSVSLPDPRAAVLQQPQGRDWRRLHNEQITYGGGWVIFGFSLLLAVFLAARGRIPLKEGFSGREVRRFSAFERANHWLTATSFLVIALTGLILLYGQYFLKPWLGPGAYSILAQGSAYTHMAFMVPFVLGVLIMTVVWLRQNLPSRLDLHWLAKGGGFFSDKGENPPARRFNAGQKLIFWAVFWGALLLVLSGISLMLPLFWLDVHGMQWVQAVHAAFGLIMIAVIIGHIYIGTVGMVGAFDAMWSGKVDRNWAKEHHSLWLAELEGSRPAPQHGPGD